MDATTQLLDLREPYLIEFLDPTPTYEPPSSPFAMPLPGGLQDILNILRGLVRDASAEALQTTLSGALEAALEGVPSTTATNMPMMLTTADVAAIFQVSVDTVVGWINTGELKAMKPNRKWRIDPEAVEDFKRQQRMKPARVDFEKEAASIIAKAERSRVVSKR